MKQYNNLEDLITFLYHQITTNKNTNILKDTTKLKNIKFDAYIESSISSPLSFTIFELSDKCELIIDNPARIIESTAAFFLFVNPKYGWTFAVKNTLENQKKLIRKEPIAQYKIRILE